MGFWKNVKKKIRSWVGGGEKASSSKPKPQVRHYASRPVVRKEFTFNKPELFRNLRSGSDEDKKSKETNNPYKATKQEYKSIVKKDVPDPKQTAAHKAQERTEKKIAKVDKALTGFASNTDKRINKGIEKRKAEREEFHERTGHKYDPKVVGTKKAAQLAKGGFDVADPVAEEMAVKYHPKAYSAARGGLSGATFGASDLVLSKRKGEGKKQEKYYQKNKSKGAEIAGEVVGSLASFGGTAGLTEKAGTKVVNKVAPRAAERLAEKEIIKSAAKRGVNKAVKKGLVSEASEELIKQAGKEKAAKIVNAIGTDIVQNLTTGAMYDINKASTEYKVGSKKWWEELGKSAAFNAAITGGVAGGSIIGGNKKIALEAAGKLARGNADEVAETVARNVDDTKGVVEFPPRDNSTIEVVGNGRRGKTVEIGADNGGIEVINPNAKKGTLDIIADDERPLQERHRAFEEKVSELMDERDSLQAGKKNAKQKARLDAVNDEIKTLNEEMTAAEHRLMDKSEQMTLDDLAKEEKKSAKPSEQMTLDEAEEPKQMTLEEAMKASEERKSAEAATEQFFDNLKGMKNQEAEMASEIRSQTGGEYSYRQGEHTAAEHAPKEEAARIKNDQDAVYKAMKDDGVAEMLNDSDSPFGVLKTANKAEMKKAADDAVTRTSGNPQEVADRLYEKAERLRKELTSKSALASSEHITLDDIADIIALRNMADRTQTKFPAKYEEAFSHIIEWQRTEAAQMLKSVDLFLKENDQRYRRMFIARDVDNYLRKVLNADSAEIEDIKRSLDANYGKGYYDKMIDALSEYKGSHNEAAFRKAYADFQAQIFMNTKPTVWDTVNLWRHSFMLSSPKTGANNIIGNLMQRMMYRISDAANIVGESIAQGINSDVKRTTALLKSGDQRRLARMYTSGRRGTANLKNADYTKGFDDQAFADVINRASDADVAEMMESSKYMGDVVKGVNYVPTTAGGKIKQGFVKGGKIGNEYVSVMLNEPDSWFVERNYRSTLLKYLEANGVNSSKTLNTKEGEKLLKEARAYAKDVALENTYKKANDVVDFLEGIRRKGHTKGSNALYKAGAIMLDAELPYLKVPANLIINNFKYSPLGALKGSVDAFRGVIKGDAELLNKATRELSKGLTGTGMAWLGYKMFCEDQTDDNSWGFIGNARDELKEYGIRDNSFKIGNKNFSIANLGIGSVQFLMGAALAEDLAERGEAPPLDVVWDALSKTVDTVADMSLMENAVSLLDLFGNGGDYDTKLSERLMNAGVEIAGDYAAQFVPNPLRGVAKAMTSADLDTGVKRDGASKIEKATQRSINNFVQGVPVLNEKKLPHRVDTHGNLINERKTSEDKWKATINNTLNPLSPREVNIPEADKEELKVTRENGEPFKPKGFDQDRKYKAVIGSGDNKVSVDLTGKEREQVARAAKHSGYDGAMSVVKKGMFGDRLGDRAQTFLQNVPDDEEAAREYLFSTPEWQNSSNEEKEKWLNAWYGEGTGNKGGGVSRGVTRTRNEEAYVNVAGNSEDDFRWQNDITSGYQKKYIDNGLEELGIDKGTYVDAIQAVYDANHKWDEEKGNIDSPNSSKKVKLGLLSVDGLTTEQRIAIYQAYRGNRTGFGWNDWDGVSGGSSYRRYGRRRHGYRRRGGGGRKAKVPTTKVSDYKASKAQYKDLASALKVRNTSASTALPTVKIEPPPKVKFKKYEV